MELSFGGYESNCGIYFNKDLTFINDYNRHYFNFMNSYNFNGKITFPLNCMPDTSQCFWCCNKFNQPFDIPDDALNCDHMFFHCWNFNQPINIPNNVQNCSGMFDGCVNFNQPVNIGNNVQNCSVMFGHLFNFNYPIIIPDTATNCIMMFTYDSKLNSPVTIGNSVPNCYNMFHRCADFNQPVNIPDSVTNCAWMFSGCYRFNQPVNIGNNVTQCYQMFIECHSFNQDLYIPDSVGNNYYGILAGTDSYNSTISIPTARNNDLLSTVSCILGFEGYPSTERFHNNYIQWDMSNNYHYNNYGSFDYPDYRYVYGELQNNALFINALDISAFKIYIRDTGETIRLSELRFVDEYNSYYNHTYHHAYRNFIFPNGFESKFLYSYDTNTNYNRRNTPYYYNAYR